MTLKTIQDSRLIIRDHVNTTKRINIIFFSLLIIIPFSVFGIMRWMNNNYTTLPYYGESQKIKQANGSEKEVPFVVPSFTFINQDNQTLTSDFVEKKIWLVLLVFYSRYFGF